MTYEMIKESDEHIAENTLIHDILRITPTGKSEVIRIAADGRLFWHGREVETDAYFRAAMLELAKNLIRS